MSWTTEKPKVPGAYWLRLGAFVSLVKVEPWVHRASSGSDLHTSSETISTGPASTPTFHFGGHSWESNESTVRVSERSPSPQYDGESRH